MENESEPANLTSHEKKEIKKDIKEKEKQKSFEEKNKKENQKKFIKYGITFIIILLIVFGLYKVVSNVKNFKPYYDKPFHWHSNINVFICGEETQLRCASSMCGIPLNHHHNDQIIHQEGNVLAKEEDLSLGSFFDSIGVKFSETEIADKKNGDLCNGNPGKVNLYVNGELNNKLRNYVPSRCTEQDPVEIRQKCDKIEVRFN